MAILAKVFDYLDKNKSPNILRKVEIQNESGSTNKGI